MRLRKRHLPFVVAAGVGTLLIGGPARSQTPPSARVVASDFVFKSADGGAPDVTIALGGTVGFSYPSGNSQHNVVFTGLQPSSCQVTTGPPSGVVSPLPNSPSGPGWVGQCTFPATGAYPFVCGLHSNMSGSVTVARAGGTPPPPPQPPPPPPPPPGPPPPPAPPARGSTGPAASALRLAKNQRGLAIRGSVRVTKAGSRLLARAYARRKALHGGASRVQLQVGRLSRRPVGAGRVAFTVKLNSVARRALRRSGRLAISLRLTVTPPTGTAYTATRTVILRPR